MYDVINTDRLTEFKNFKGICYSFNTAEVLGDTRWHGYLHFADGKCAPLSHVESVKEIEAEAIHLLEADVIGKLSEQVHILTANKQKLIDELMLLDSDILRLRQSSRIIKDREEL